MAHALRARAPLALGDEAPAFARAPSVDGRRYGLADFADKTALVLVFDSNRCPTAKAYVPRMIELQRDYAQRGVQLVAVNSTNPYLYAEESFEAMAVRARESGFTFPYLKDEDQSIAKAFGAACTFHVFVLDQRRRLRYRGRFDDSRNPARVTSQDLRSALDDVLAGRDVRVPETEPFGCGLDLE